MVALGMSKELAKRASEYIGQEVIIKDMRELDFQKEFIGVWACASILHIPIEDIKDNFQQLFLKVQLFFVAILDVRNFPFLQ